MELVQEGPYRFRIEPEGTMRVPGLVFASRSLMPDPAVDESLLQVVNVAALPGIVVASYAMPDVHWGYGFPIGGVAATDVAAGGVISPGGVGFDISCGVRLLAADLDREALAARLGRLMDLLDHAIPRGLGRGAVWRLTSRSQLEAVLDGGSRYVVGRGHGTTRDVERCEDQGSVAAADGTAISARAEQRGLGQLGSLGSGNHFLEVQAVELIYDDAVAARRLCVHRKGATRALPPGHPDLPPDLTGVGQPVLIPCTMGTASYVLTGVAGNPAFHSTCHGAGRLQSRHQAARAVRGQDLRNHLEAAGIAVRGASWRGLAEEAPSAYKDVDAVIAASEGAGLCRKIARLVPLGVVKG